MIKNDVRERGSWPEGWGTIPATIQSSWNTAVISASSGGMLAEAEEVVVRGRARIRATLIWSAQPIRRVESSCQCILHLNKSARGASAGLSMKVIRDEDAVSYILIP